MGWKIVVIRAIFNRGFLFSFVSGFLSFFHLVWLEAAPDRGHNLGHQRYIYPEAASKPHRGSVDHPLQPIFKRPPGEDP